MQPYQENFLPGSLTGKLSLMAPPQQSPMQSRQGPGRSKLLAELLAQKVGPDSGDYTTAAVKAGGGLMDAYKGMNPPKGVELTPEEAATRERAGYASGLGGVATGAGSLVPGWGGKIAQLAGIVASKYGEQKATDAKGQALAKMLSETDPEKRARMAVLLGGQ